MWKCDTLGTGRKKLLVFLDVNSGRVCLCIHIGCRGASQLGGSLLGIPRGYKANKL